jgi:hypothetical protein
MPLYDGEREWLALSVHAPQSMKNVAFAIKYHMWGLKGSSFEASVTSTVM